MNLLANSYIKRENSMPTRSENMLYCQANADLTERKDVVLVFLLIVFGLNYIRTVRNEQYSMIVTQHTINSRE